MTKTSAKTLNPLDKLERVLAAEQSRRAAERDRRRAEFPGLAEMVDAFRAKGFDVRLLAGIERGKEIGKVDDELREVYAREIGD